MQEDSLEEVYFNEGIKKGRQESGFYTVIPNYILESDQLSMSAKVLFGIIVGLTRHKGYCWATNETLADRMGASVRTVQFGLVDLEKIKLIEIDPGRSEKGTYRQIKVISILPK